MICFKDKTFCASPDCNNECGRKMTDEEKEELKVANLPENWDGMLGVSYRYFCGEPEYE